ncbi:hypothetical protein [uncultured Deinococcus sp.]|uniref:hypothetical protein n=1 Tax=uncultured Deinococcus sp. TaxID=158789 RepID=UPI0025E27F9B|nr:hypothetical protein [uncultured Deinococcus sp.]
MALTVTPDDVFDLIPGAPAVELAHLALALLWAKRELRLRRVDPDALEGDALLTARTAVAAKALALNAGIGGVVSLDSSATEGGLKGIKLPGIELTLAPQSRDARGNLVLAASDWAALAEEFLALAMPVSTRPRLFPGASR